MSLLDGKKLAAQTRSALKTDVANFVDAHGRAPGLDVILVGNDPASEVYVKGKEKACKKVGVRSRLHIKSETISEAELLALIAQLNEDDTVDGILVQLPVPEHINSDKVIESISPLKDVDGFHPINMGKLLAGQKGIVPCTPLGCMKLIDETNVDLSGLNAVVVGRSNIVGKPMAQLLLARNATVTICHSRTKKLAHLVAEADVLVAAVGRPEMIKGEWVKTGAIVIDVGINRLDDGKLVGDVEFEAASEKAAWITPVPKGVGPMTIACLLSNTLTAAKQRLVVR